MKMSQVVNTESTRGRFMLEKHLAPKYFIISPNSVFLELIENGEFVERLLALDNPDTKVWQYLVQAAWGEYLTVARKSLSERLGRTVFLENKAEFDRLVEMLKVYFIDRKGMIINADDGV